MSIKELIEKIQDDAASLEEACGLAMDELEAESMKDTPEWTALCNIQNWAADTQMSDVLEVA